MKLIRNCAICSRKLDINLLKGNRIPKNFYYFGRIKLPIGKGKWKEIGESSILKPVQKKTDIVKWTGKEKEFEHWECKKCFKS